MMLNTFSLQEMNYADIQQYIASSQREYAQGMLDQEEYPDYETALRAARNEVNYYYSHVVEGESHYAYHIMNALTNERAGILAFSILIRKNKEIN